MTRFIINEEEVHMPKFTGWWIPSEIVELFDKKEINLREMVLLAVIDSLSGDTGVGCYASNAWLTKKIQLNNEEHVQRLIRKLTRMGLLIQSKPDGRLRHLITPWKLSLTKRYPRKKRRKISG